MTRAEPSFAWTAPFGAPATAPMVLSAPRRAWWHGALTLSLLLHAGLVLLVGDEVTDAVDRMEPPTIEVSLVVPAAPEAPVAAPEPPPRPAQAPSPEIPPAPPAERAQKADKDAPPAPQAAPPDSAAATPEKSEAPAERPAEAAKPGKPESPATARPGEEAKPKPKPTPPPSQPRPQIAARPPAPESGHGVEGTASPRRTDLAGEATVRAIVSPAPKYPPIAIRLLEEGTVILSIHIDEDGVPKDVTVLQSSRFGSLDQAAVEAARQWRFAVPKHGGHAVATTVNVPFVFNLKHASR